MKFEYGENDQARKPVAYIDRDGDLRIKSPNSTTVADIWTIGGARIKGFDWSPHDPANKKLFYEGDSLTITF